MAHVSHSDHPTDADLLERFIARDTHPTCALRPLRRAPFEAVAGPRRVSTSRARRSS